jgi:hypothetical protein
MNPVLDRSLLRRRFTPAEDGALKRLVSVYGLDNWGIIASFMPERNARQCRERYESYLAPNVYNAPWTDEEDGLLRRMVGEVGLRWVKLVSHFPGRNTNSLKNRWHKVLCKKDTPPAPQITNQPLPILLAPPQSPLPVPSPTQSDDFAEEMENDVDVFCEGMSFF